MPGENGQPAVGNPNEERVSTAALLAAMELIRGMSDNPAATPGEQLLDDIRQAEIRPEELTRAFATLLYGFLRVFNDADVDMVVGSVTRRLRRLQLVPEVMVTRMRGAMLAAAAGQPPLRWREQFGPDAARRGTRLGLHHLAAGRPARLPGRRARPARPVQRPGRRDAAEMLLTVDPEQDRGD